MRPDVLAEHLSTTIRGLVAPLSIRIKALEELRADGGAIASLSANLGALRARVEELETREPLPGPPGPPGPPGLDGKDGAPGLRYLGVHVTGKTYDEGDLVTAGGSAWYCKTTTTSAPGDGRPDWVLMVKHGRDLRDPARRNV